MILSLTHSIWGIYENKAGFRPGRSCAQQIRILRRVLEGFRDYQLLLVVTFIDFKKAFDSINRKVMFAVLRHYGIPEAVVNAISVLYKNSKSALMVDGGLSDPFDVTTGVLQGDVLAPFLFVVLVDYRWKKVTSQLDSGIVTHPRRSRRHPAKSLNDLDFADDIALLESSISRAQAQLTKTAEAAADLGLVISAPKIEYMTVSCNPQPALQVYGDPINHVSDFRYLGSMVASGSSDLKRRKSLAWCAFWKLEQLWKSPHISITTKVKLFNTTCVTILLYGCESWVISQSFPGYGKKINAFATSCYRVMLNIKRIDHVLNTTVYSMTNTVPLIHLVRHRQLKFLVTSSECQRKSLLEDMLYTFQPLANGDLVDHVLHTLIMYKDCLGIMKEQCKNSRLPHLLMIVVHGETLWSPSPQPMDIYPHHHHPSAADDDGVDMKIVYIEQQQQKK